jgi:hypothetical protein
MTTLTSPHDLLAAVPFLIGYHPSASLVLITAKENHLGMAMRIDYPEAVPSIAFHELFSHISREECDGILMVAYVPDAVTDSESVILQMREVAEGLGMPVREAITVHNSRWRSLLCDDIECCPIEGNLLPEITSSRIAAEQVADGTPMPFRDLEDLVNSISALPLSHDVDFVALVEAARIFSDEEDLQNKEQEGARAVAKLMQNFETENLALIAKVLGSLTDIQVRDFSLGLHAAENIDQYWSNWRYLLRVAPPGFVAPVATIFAAISYERGFGAIAQRGLDRAFDDESMYSLAALLRRIFAAGWPPTALTQMRAELHPKVRQGIFGD